jgi:hypothetical protein
MKCRIRQSNLANPCHQAGESHRKETRKIVEVGLIDIEFVSTELTYT